MAVDKQVEGKAWRPSETLGHRPGEGQGKPAPHLGMGGGQVAWAEVCVGIWHALDFS